MTKSETRLELALERGRDWADAVRASLADDGRPATGGWPCTMSEARALVGSLFGGEPDATPSEREGLSRQLYDSARNHWLEKRAPLVPEPKD